MSFFIWIKWTLLTFLCFGGHTTNAHHCQSRLVNRNNEISEILCTETSFDDLQYHILEWIHSDHNMTNRHRGLSIEKSSFPSFEEFYDLNELLDIYSLEIVDSGILYIGAKAFEGMIDIERLNLSKNKLRNLNFISNLIHLNVLDMSYNNLESVANVFGNLPNMKTLLLNHCFIKQIDLDVFSRNFLRLLDLSNNLLKTPNLDGKYVQTVNFSGNPLETLKVTSQVQNRVYREPSIRANLTSGRIFVGNKPLNLLNFAHDAYFGARKSSHLNSFLRMLLDSELRVEEFSLKQMDFSPTFTIDSIEAEGVKGGKLRYRFSYLPENVITNYLIVNNYVFDELKPDTFSVLPWGGHLGLSSNKIRILRQSAFKDSKFATLDLSNNLIEHIEGKAFGGLIVNKIFLNNNKIVQLGDCLTPLHTTEVIDLSHNEIHQIKNDNFLGLSSLELLDLSHNQIKDINAFAFISLDTLSTLDLSYNFLHVLNSDLFHGANLQHLNLSFNKISVFDGGKPSKFCLDNLWRLKTLDLRNSTDAIVAFPKRLFANMTSLETLYLSNLDNSLGKYCFSTRQNLKRLELSNIHDLLPGGFTRLRNLINLTITQSTIKELKNGTFFGLVNLTTLSVGTLKVKSSEPGCFKGLFRLRQIQAKHLLGNVRVIHPFTFLGLHSLATLDLSNLSLTGMKPRAFDGLTTLVNLTLANNTLTKVENATFLNLDILENLDLSGNDLTTLEGDAFLGVGTLMRLNLTRNNLSELPVGVFKGLVKLSYLGLAHNNFTKFNIGVFSGLKHLTILDLSNNRIQDVEAKIIYPLRNLKILLLNQNRLVTVQNHLPKHLPGLKYIGIGFNKWKCARIPIMLQILRTFRVDYVRFSSLDYDNDNVEGIRCFDVCKFLMCDHEYQIYNP